MNFSDAATLIEVFFLDEVWLDQLTNGFTECQATGPFRTRTWGQNIGAGKSLKRLVGARRFELRTPCSQSRCATRLRYAPTIQPIRIIIALHAIMFGLPDPI